jgi:hypothetical protein
MTAYHLTPTTTLPALVVQEAKEKRKQVLAKAAQTRKANYLRFLKKQCLQASNAML